ncbi:MAG TPA: PTS sugar transporter subunit IIC [Gemmatimonadales bacterium]
MSGLTLALLLAWGTLAGVDLVSWPQAFLSRPVVVGAIAGVIIGDPVAGLRVGVLLELFALDVLPVGAARYPDYGPATVAATAWARGLDWTSALGPAVFLALAVGWVGGRSMEALRRRNGRRLRKLEPRIAAGDPRAVARLQWHGLADDVLRAALLTALALLVAIVSRIWIVVPEEPGRALTLVVIAGGLGAALTGTVRRTTPASLLRWLGVGLAAGGVAAWLI